MIDRTRALIVAAAAAVIVLFGLVAGYAIGNTAADSNDDSTDDTRTAAGQDGPGLPAGPTRIEGEVPMGFTPDEDGALSAATTWTSYLIDGPASERPEAIAQVLASGVDATELVIRVSYHPFAGRVSMTSATRATVDLLSLHTGTQGLEAVGLTVEETRVSLSWDDQAMDWRITAIDTIREEVPTPLDALDVEGYRALRPTGTDPGGVLLEQVPGE